MTISIGHLGPAGTYTEAAAIAYVKWLSPQIASECLLCPYTTISQTLEASARGEVMLAIVPVENSIEGSVTMTLDTLWRLDALQIQHALDLPIAHALICHATSLDEIKTVYSHPQAIAQCQGWLQEFTPVAQLIPLSSTTEALEHLQKRNVAAIASQRAAELYNLPILAYPINDYPDNYTRFWVVSSKSEDKSHFTPASSLMPALSSTHTSLAFSVPANLPGTLTKPLQVFASRGINLSRIESRPTKRSLGEYLFFIDLECDIKEPRVKSAFQELTAYTETLKIFGSYSLLPV